MRAATYERVSTEEQANEGFSLEAQQEHNIERITAEGWIYVGSFIDPGYSGKNLSRPAMKKLMKEIEKQNIDAIVVHKLDRLTRDIGDLYNMLALFEKHNVKFISITEKIDTSSAMGRMFIFILGIFAQWYRENLSEEVKKGMKKRAQKGLHNITVPLFGYERKEDGGLIIKPEEAKWVKWIFEQYINGIGSTNIAKRLNDMGIRRNQGARWDQRKVMMTLNNLHYIGKIHWKEGNKPEEDRVVAEGKHEAIVDEEIFDQAQNILKRRKEGTISTNSYEYVFGGIITCAKCGKKYTGKYSKRRGTLYRVYVCSSKSKYGTCDQSAISESNLAKLIFKNVNFIPILDGFTDNESIDAREEVEKQISASECRRSRWQMAYGDGYMPYEDFAKRMSEEMEHLKLLEEKLLKVSSTTPSKVTPEEALQALNLIQEEWGGYSSDTQKQIMQSLFKQVTILKSNGVWEITNIKLA